MVKVITESSEVPKGKVVIDFFATWCGPCKRIAPVYKELSQKFPSITFLKVDVDEAEAFAAEYSVTSLPTILFLNDHTEFALVEGADLQKVVQHLEALEKA